MTRPTNMYDLEHDIDEIDRKISKSTIIRDQVFSEAYDGVVKGGNSWTCKKFTILNWGLLRPVM